MKFTKATVSRLALPPGKTEVIYFDDGFSGFGLRLRAGSGRRPAVSRTWIYQYRFRGKQRRYILLSVDAGENLADTFGPAYDLADTARAQVRLGVDPQAEKQKDKLDAAKKLVTLEIVAKKYIAAVSKDLRKSSAAALEYHLKTLWAPLKQSEINEIKLAHVAARIRTIADEKGGYTANRARASLHSLYSWAIGEGLANGNPVAGSNKATKEQKRDRVLSDNELVLIWRYSGDDHFGSIVKLLILLASRRDEVACMGRSEISASGSWVVPGHRTKNALPLSLPLPAAAQNIIDKQPIRDNRDFVFGYGEGGFSGFSNAKEALDKRIKKAGFKMASWRIHDIRRSVSTGMNNIGILPHVVEEILNHVSGHRAGVAGTYNYSRYDKEKREALQAWADHVTALVTPPAAAEAAE
ncbi:phage integrase central domain-containing protein [Methylocella sp. CPCC 101449]|uniref:tyrosine-type recombinase/integrase n=1 Tax=Methylocella sp. CPCC 101449 TaxID=2987531 RepID=UPI00288CB5CE|nr:integrase arm-type DNA-binding domain-containing protein [Methylocella sp. CPCC 101449]MDT2024562.1 integrase arm-type DNA-binding domain-containing protein [Methylocella sp. CPCC 101449]